MNEDELIEELTYACYVHNRETSPNLMPHAWKSVFKNVDKMEARYQLGKANDYADAMIHREKLERHEGRPEHDMSAAGTALKAGS